jgi:hypothetical protein
MAACFLGLVAVLRAGYGPGGELRASGALLLLPATLYFTLNRFDIVPALLTALGLAYLGRRRVVASALLFAAATMVKVYPLFLAPLVVRYLWPRRRDALRWAAAYLAGVLLFLVPPLLLDGWEAVWAPYRFQLARARDGWSLYDSILPVALADNNLVGRGFRLGGLLVTLAALLWRRPPDLAGVLRRCAVVLIVFTSLSVFYSPQWILWLVPLLVPLAARQRGLGWLIVALDVATFFTFPVWPPVGLHQVVIARFIVLGTLAVLLLCREWGGKGHAPVPLVRTADPT